MTKKWLYIFAHKKVREFDAKLLLACFAVDRGYDVLLGRTGILRTQITEGLPNGVIIHVGATPQMLREITQFVQMGHKVVSFDEEATAFIGTESFKTLRVHRETINLISALFSWGNHHTSFLLSIAPDLEDKFFTTGHPRLDILHPEVRSGFFPQVAKIKAKYGDYILVNSNMSVDSAKHLDDDEKFYEFFKTTKHGRTDSNGKSYERQLYERHNRRKQIDLIHHIAYAFPNKTIIVRPHFADSPELWRKYISSDLKNVKVVHEGNVVPWLIGADAMIQSGCTTAIESYLVGKPSISYLPDLREEFISPITRSVSFHAGTPEDVIRIIERISIGAMQDEIISFRDNIQEYMTIDDEQLSCERILDIIDTLALEEHQDMTSFLGLQRKKPHFIKGILRKFYGWYSPSSEEVMTLKEAQSVLQSFRDNLGLFEDIRIEAINHELFHVIKQ